MKGAGRRLREWVSRWPLKTQISVSMSMVSFFVMAFLGVVIFGISKEIIERNYQTSHRFHMELTDELLTMQLEPAVDEARDLLTNETFVEILKTESSTSAYFSSANQVKLREILLEILDLDVVREIVVISEQGHVIYTTEYARTLSWFNCYYKGTDILEESWVPLTEEAKGKEVFFGYNLVLKENKPDTFSMAKKLIEPFSGESFGYLIMNFQDTLISYLFQGKEQVYSSDSFLILETDERKYAKPEESAVYYSGDEAYREAILRDYQENRQTDFLFTSYHNALTGWDIVGIVKKSELKSDANYIGIVTIAAGIVLACIQMILAKRIARQISRPLSVLEQTMQEVAEGKRNVTARFPDTEVGRIGNQFKNLVNNNLELKEKAQQMELREKEAELLLLQSQINPHFLYNTLDNIYMMALVKEEDEIADTVRSLSELFRLSLNSGEKLIPVEKELRHIEMYMKIQASRFKDRYRLILDVDEGMMQKPIPVFLLQPLVENAVLHGLEPKLGSGTVVVKGRLFQKYMGFSVEDDGVGIQEPERLERGYGIKNIRERMRIYYGEENCALDFESRNGEGTRILLRLPVKLPAEEAENV